MKQGIRLRQLLQELLSVSKSQYLTAHAKDPNLFRYNVEDGLLFGTGRLGTNSACCGDDVFQGQRSVLRVLFGHDGGAEYRRQRECKLVVTKE
jgi:hypothetical protein